MTAKVTAVRYKKGKVEPHFIPAGPRLPARGGGPAAGLAAAASRQEGGARRYVARRPDPAPGAGARRGAGPGWAARRKCAAALGWARAGPPPQPAPPGCGEWRRYHGAVEVCVDQRAGERGGWWRSLGWVPAALGAGRPSRRRAGPVGGSGAPRPGPVHRAEAGAGPARREPVTGGA